jgi:hypothetical protein
MAVYHPPVGVLAKTHAPQGMQNLQQNMRIQNIIGKLAVFRVFGNLRLSGEWNQTTNNLRAVMP